MRLSARGGRQDNEAQQEAHRSPGHRTRRRPRPRRVQCLGTGPGTYAHGDSIAGTHHTSTHDTGTHNVRAEGCRRDTGTGTDCVRPSTRTCCARSVKRQLWWWRERRAEHQLRVRAECRGCLFRHRREFGVRLQSRYRSVLHHDLQPVRVRGLCHWWQRCFCHIHSQLQRRLTAGYRALLSGSTVANGCRRANTQGGKHKMTMPNANWNKNRDATVPQPGQPNRQTGGAITKKLFKILAGSAIVILAIAGTTMGIITMVQLNHTQHALTQTQAQLSSTRAQLSSTQTEVQCMSPTINYLSQFSGWYGQEKTDSFGNVTGTWYMPAANTGQPAASSQMGTC